MEADTAKHSQVSGNWWRRKWWWKRGAYIILEINAEETLLDSNGCKYVLYAIVKNRSWAN